VNRTLTDEGKKLTSIDANAHFDVLIIGGFGHVGLPLGLVLADAGCQVALYDIDRKRGETIVSGRMPFLEYDAEPVLQRVVGKTLHIVENLECISAADSIVITIGTPVDEFLNPKVLPILKLVENLVPYLRPDHHIILRSTVYPGTSERLYDSLQQHRPHIDFSFCPERIAQGYAIRELRKLPQIISGFSESALRRSRLLFEKLGVQVLETTVKEAELAKLFLNSWRYIQFAAANQFYMMAVENDADFGRLHHAMTFGYDRGQDFPRAGFAAGPCLLKDTMQLSAFYHNGFLLGHAGMLVNEGMPNFILNQLRKTRDLKQEVVGILGMAFKADVDDIRDSLSYKLGKLLRFSGAHVLYSDEFAKDPTFVSKEELIERSSIIIIGVPHSAYKSLKIPERVYVVDIWGLLSQGHESR
jgi:UDP-N-acetyl-D-mannosaminuronic acid dehydrogenase